VEIFGKIVTRFKDIFNMAVGLKDPGTAGIVKRTTLAETVIAVPGTDYVIPSGMAAAISAAMQGATGKSLSPVQDLAAAKAINTTSTTDYPDKSTILIEDLGLYKFDRNSTATNDDNLVIQPTTGSGRFLKLFVNVTALSQLTGDSTHRTVTDAEKATWNAGTGSGGSGTGSKNFAAVTFASTINVDFNSATYYAIGATGNISFTKSNDTNGANFEIEITKNTASDVILAFPSSSWPAAIPYNNAPGNATVIQTEPEGFKLTGASGSVYTLYIHYSNGKPTLYLNYLPSFYDPNPLQTNIVVYDSSAVFVNPGNTTAETSVYHLLIPAGVMKTKSKLTVNFCMKRANNGEANVQFKVRAGASSTPTSNPIFYDFGQSNNGILPASAYFQNNNSVSSQVCITSYNAAPFNYPVDETNLSIPTGSAFHLDITVQKNTGTHIGAAGLVEVILSNI
jgi:hypothetical protein